MRRIYLIITVLCLTMAASCSDNGKDDPSRAPAAPAGLVLHDRTETSLTFQWDPVNGAVKYEWTLTKGGSSAGSGSVSSRNVIVDNLEKAAEYRFGVRAVNASGLKSDFVYADAETAGSSVVPPPPGPSVDPATYYPDFKIPSVEEDGVARAFPGAEGCGMYTTGGRGGKVYHVTKLLDDTDTQGTLRYGIEKGGRPLTIVFDVAGTIALKKDLKITSGDLTIAGQTAPGDGICLKNYTFRIHASNVIVRFIRCRMGDEAASENDAMQVMDKYGDSFNNIIIDHCSISWSTDECASFYGMKDFTFQWNIVSESLRNSIHDKGPHGYGGIWGGTNASYHHNLLAHHDSRNPRIDHDYVSHQKGPVSIFNNVVYNWFSNTCYGGESSANNGSDYRKYNFFNNFYKPGPATKARRTLLDKNYDVFWLIQPTTSCSNCGGTIIPGHFFIDGNVMDGLGVITADNWKAGNGTKSHVSVYIDESLVPKIKETSMFSTDAFQSVHTAALCFNPVLTYAGASLSRDDIDARIARETKNGTFTYEGSNLNPKDKDGNPVVRSYKGLIDTQTDVADGTWKNGWPVYEASPEQMAMIKDTDEDSIPDWFEDAFALDKNDPSDATAFSYDSDKRYSNFEMYLHYLVRDIVASQNTGGEYKKF